MALVREGTEIALLLRGRHCSGGFKDGEKQSCETQDAGKGCFPPAPGEGAEQCFSGYLRAGLMFVGHR